MSFYFFASLSIKTVAKAWNVNWLEDDVVTKFQLQQMFTKSVFFLSEMERECLFQLNCFRFLHSVYPFS